MVQLSTIEDPSGFRVELLDFGARIHRIVVPAAAGPVDTVLHYPKLDDYLQDAHYLGATLGRYANRIDRGRLYIDKQRHQLDCEPGRGPHCLHGGTHGFSGRHWQSTAGTDSITYNLVSAHADQGFPGQLQASVCYQLLHGWRLSIEYRASCDRPTAVNLANHAYFNLDGLGQSMDRQLLRLSASRYTPVDGSMLPTGEISTVAGSTLDFRNWTPLGKAPALDHNFLIDGAAGSLRHAAGLRSTVSGLQLDVFSTQAGLQVYSGAHLAGHFAPTSGLCLEAQNIPNAPNMAPASGLHGGVLRPGALYQQRVEYVFSRPGKRYSRQPR